jgi:hypothetical protein
LHPTEVPQLATTGANNVCLFHFLPFQNSLFKISIYDLESNPNKIKRTMCYEDEVLFYINYLMHLKIMSQPDEIFCCVCWLFDIGDDEQTQYIAAAGKRGVIRIIAVQNNATNINDMTLDTFVGERIFV